VRETPCEHTNVKIWRQWESKEVDRDGEPRFILYNARCEHCGVTGQGTTSLEAAEDVSLQRGVYS
jgi:hypothetical protein